jgi:Xaa-Pro aminopeptidase
MSASASTATEVARTRRVASQLHERGVDLLLVTHPMNLRYLTGFTGSNGLALIVADEGDVHRFLTDFRYDTQSAAQIPALFEREIVAVDLVEAAARLLLGEAPEVGLMPNGGAEAGPAPSGGAELTRAAPTSAPAPASATASALALMGGRLGFEEGALTVKQHLRLRELLPASWELSACGGVVEALREVKEPLEIARIRAAAELADEALRGVLEGGLAGRSEREVAIDLELRMRRLGAQAPSFPSIVAAGPHGALPHAEPRDAPIPRDALVTIDWGALHEGYCSDCTRTYATGEQLPEGAREVYELVLSAQLAGLAAVRPGCNGKEVDGAAREVIEAAGHGEHFGHGLGHGVGLEVHEAPRLSRTAGEQPLRAGNVVTVEPGVYVPGRYGVRIEDLVAVTENGGLVLNGLDKQLTVVG